MPRAATRIGLALEDRRSAGHPPNELSAQEAERNPDDDRQPALEQRVDAESRQGDRDGDSPREREVAALIARGLTSREMAELLIVSEKTADSHADHIRAKPGLRSRSEIAAWAVAHGLHTLPNRATTLAPEPGLPH